MSRPDPSVFKKRIARLRTKKQTERIQDNAQSAFVDHHITHPAVGLTPAKLHQLLTAAESGDISQQANLFADMEERDGHIFSEMQKRKLAVTALDHSIQPPPNASAAEKQYTQTIAELISYIDDFEDVTLDALAGIGNGFSNQEINWVQDGNYWVMQSLDYQLPQLFKVNNKAKTFEIKTQFDESEQLEPMLWFTHIHKAKSGYISRAGLYRVLSWYYIFKNYSIRDVAEFLEIYGLPMRVGTYPSGATSREKSTLLNAVVQIGHRAAGIVPQGMMIDFKEAAKGSSDPFFSMVDWCEKGQSKVITGGTLNSQADGKTSTNALGQIHNEGRIEIRNSDVKQLQTGFRKQLIAKLMRVNFPHVDPRRYPYFVFDTSESEDMTVYAPALKILVESGMQIPQSYAHEKLKIPQPVEGEPVLSVQPAPASTPETNNKTQLTAALSAQQSSITEEERSDRAQQALELELEAQLSNDALNEIAENLTLSTVRRLKSAKNADEALAILTDTLPTEDINDLATVLDSMLFASQSWGELNNQVNIIKQNAADGVDDA